MNFSSNKLRVYTNIKQSGNSDFYRWKIITHGHHGKKEHMTSERTFYTFPQLLLVTPLPIDAHQRYTGSIVSSFYFTDKLLRRLSRCYSREGAVTKDILMIFAHKRLQPLDSRLAENDKYYQVIVTFRHMASSDSNVDVFHNSKCCKFQNTQIQPHRNL